MDFFTQTQALPDGLGTPPPHPASSQPPGIVRNTTNPDPYYPSQKLIDIFHARIKPEFTKVYNSIIESNGMAITDADKKYWLPILATIQQQINGFVGAKRRKTKKKRSRRS